MKKPLALSLIIPAYNEERHLVACLDSVAAQTVKPLEVIVVDNNSTDNTAKIARSYPFVRLIKEKQQGIVFARNAGFNAARGDIIGRIDADSILPPNWVKRIMTFYADTAHRGTAFTGGGYFYNVPLPRVSSWVQDQIAFRLNRLLMGHYILYGSNMGLPRNVWNAVQSHACVRTDIHEDLDLAIHLHQAGYDISYKAGIGVGVKMRRVFTDFGQLWGNMMLWPHTLRIHGLWRWFFAWIGGLLLFVLTPLILWPAKILQKLHHVIAKG